MNTLGKKESNNSALAFWSIWIVYLYSLFFSILVLTFKQKEFATKIMGVCFLITALITVCIFFAQAIKNGIQKVSLYWIAFIVLVIISILVTSSLNGGFSAVAIDTLFESFVKFIPAVLMGLIASQKKLLPKMINAIDFFIFITGIGFVSVLIQGIVQGIDRPNMDVVFGMDYQGISYFAAYMYVLTLYMLFFGNQYVSKKWRKTVLFQFLRLIFAILQIILSLYSGGRGGFFLIVFSTIAVFLFKSIIDRRFFWILLGFVIISFATLIIVFLKNHNSLFEMGFERIVEFIGNGGIDWSGTSGRDTIYQNAFLLIEESPLFGYGITGGSYYGVPQAHNLFLDILIEGGSVFFLFSISIFIVFLRKMIILIKGDRRFILLAAIFLGDFVNLMFSTIYWRSTAIWFVLAYVLSFRKYKEVSNESKVLSRLSNGNREKMESIFWQN